MYDVNELVNRLANGETEEDIAAEMTKALNAAVSKRKEAEAAKSDANRKAAARTCAREIIIALSNYFYDIGQEELAEHINTDDTAIDEIVEMIDSIGQLVSTLNKIAPNDKDNKELNVNLNLNNTNKKTAPRTTDWADDAIFKFLAGLG